MRLRCSLRSSFPLPDRHLAEGVRLEAVVPHALVREADWTAGRHALHLVLQRRGDAQEEIAGAGGQGVRDGEHDRHSARHSARKRREAAPGRVRRDRDSPALRDEKRLDPRSKEEPAEAHFSLGEVHGALTLEIKNGYRGYHIGSCYLVPKNVVATRILANYSQNKGATITYSDYNGSEESFLIPKHSAMVLIAAEGTYDFVLSTGLYDQTITNANSLGPGVVKGENVNSEKEAKDRWLFRFVATAEKVGFERNSDDPTKVILEAPDEIILKVNAKDSHFAGNWSWETSDKKWISWKGKTAADFGFTTGINTTNASTESEEAIYDLTGRKIAQPAQGLYIQNGKKYIAK